MATNPMDQFKVEPIFQGPKIGPFDLTFTNASLWMVITVAAVILFMGMTMRGKLIPGRLQSMGELSYEFIADMLKETTGPEAVKWFPYVFTIFFFILFANLLGMNPYAFTTTSHIAVTAALAVFTILAVVVAGIWKNGLKWFKIFAPAGLPFVMYPIIIPIEIISFVSRPVTLAVRLFANMTAGHVRSRHCPYFGYSRYRRPRIPGCGSASLRVCDPDLCLSQRCLSRRPSLSIPSF